MSDGMHEMGIAKADPSVYVKRVVSLRRHVNHGEGCSVRELVAGADDKGIEGVLDVEGEFDGLRLQSPCDSRAEPRIGDRERFRSGGNITERFHRTSLGRRGLGDDKSQLI